jgi:hypothetical protein
MDTPGRRQINVIKVDLNLMETENPVSVIKPPGELATDN